jgi:4'-phosphopantetheinyl transferase EntD
MMDAAPFRLMLFQPLLMPTVLLAEMPPVAADPSRLFSEELRAVERAVDKRRYEFAAGRLLARDLLARMFVGESTRGEEFIHRPLLNDADRVPIWPAGVVGSITHCHGLCAVAIASMNECAGIGLDVEPAQPLKSELEPHILRAGDAFYLEVLPRDVRALGGILTFVIKEAVYKSVYPLCRRFLDFQDVGLVELAITQDHIDGIRGVFKTQVHVVDAAPFGNEYVSGQFRITEHFVAAAVVLPLADIR